MRGMWITPQPLPAQIVATRIQHELSASYFPSRSQWNCTFTRLYLSVKISSPAGPTTTAVCVPWTVGFGVMRAGRNGNATGIHSNVVLVVERDRSAAPVAAAVGMLAVCVTRSARSRRRRRSGVPA